MEKGFSRVILMLLFLSIFTLAAVMTPNARAQSISVTLNPSEGPVGTQVIVQVTSGQYGGTTFGVTFGTANVGTIFASRSGSIFSNPSFVVGSTIINVPTVSQGEYVVTVTSSSGEFGTATFTVTPEATVAPTETPGTTPTEPSTGTPSGSAPTYVPVKPKTEFWSPLMVGVVAFVVAAGCFVTVMFVRRGRQERPSLEDYSSYKPASATEKVPPYRYRSPVEETSPYRFRSSVPDTSPSYPTRQVPSTRSTVTPTVSQTVTRGQPPPYTKVCKHCKRVVRDDLNICPYCLKRLR